MNQSSLQVTDCSAITSVKTNKELKPKIARWRMRLLKYVFTLVHREDSRMAHIDALSRAPDKLPTADVHDWVVTMQLKYGKVINIKAVLKGEIKSDQEKQIRSEYSLRNLRLYYKDKEGSKLVIPKGHPIENCQILP